MSTTQREPVNGAGGTSFEARLDAAARLLDEACIVVDRDVWIAEHYARRLAGPLAEHRADVVSAAVDALARRTVSRVVTNGWTPNDLAQVVHHKIGSATVPLVASVIADYAGDHDPASVPEVWRAELEALGRQRRLDPATVRGAREAIRLCALVRSLPPLAGVLPAPGHAAAALGLRAPRRVTSALTKVRSLLAKAESTEFPDEAEALSAKAQEMISRYALDRLLEEGQGDDRLGPAVGPRRIWIDPPYVFPKAMLVGAVAEANRCRCVVSESIGFATVVGDERDLDSVELLVTSLLVQADAAMFRHGARRTRYGASRTAAFRRSFLVAYATRIGERLAAATSTAVATARHGAELVPLLAAHDERVAAERDRLFPLTTAKSVTISDGEGWAAGSAAADLAVLDTHKAISPTNT